MDKLQRLVASPAKVDQAIKLVGGTAMALSGFAAVVFIIAALLARL